MDSGYGDSGVELKGVGIGASESGVRILGIYYILYIGITQSRLFWTRTGMGRGKGRVGRCWGRIEARLRHSWVPVQGLNFKP